MPPAPIAIQPLAAADLYRVTDLSSLTFATTTGLQPIDGLISQPRALETILRTLADETGLAIHRVGAEPGSLMHQTLVPAIRNLRERLVVMRKLSIRSLRELRRRVAYRS